MTDQMRDESEQGSSSKCIHTHEGMYLAWTHQGDGYNYFHCQFCGWAKPDLDAPVIKAALLAAEQRERNRCIEIVRDEEEPKAEHLSVEMLEVFLKTPEQTLIAAIVATKKSIEARILKSPSEGTV